MVVVEVVVAEVEVDLVDTVVAEPVDTEVGVVDLVDMEVVL